jgi:hypothetical protein
MLASRQAVSWKTGGGLPTHPSRVLGLVSCFENLERGVRRIGCPQYLIECTHANSGDQEKVVLESNCRRMINHGMLELLGRIEKDMKDNLKKYTQLRIVPTLSFLR